MIKKLLRLIFSDFLMQMMLMVLLPLRIKMYWQSKLYAWKYPQGSIVLHHKYSSADYSSLNGENVILFVVYSPKSYLMYERYFELLCQLNYKIVVISNGKLDDKFLNTFSRCIYFACERFNMGRDFGAYKEFFLLLQNKQITPKNLIMCNDSVFANLKKNDIRFIEFFKKNDEADFLGVAEYVGKPGYHVQSYFLKLSSNVIQHPKFIKFWNNFLISENRRHNIHKGEVKLSEAILSAGFRPVVFLGTDRITEQLTKNPQVLQRLLSELLANDHINKQPGMRALVAVNAEYCRRKRQKRHDIKLLESQIRMHVSNIIAHFGILHCPFIIIEEAGFPFLKRDIVYRQLTQFGLIRLQGEAFDQDLLDEFVEDQRTRKRVWHLKTWKDQLMYHTGIN